MIISHILSVLLFFERYISTHTRDLMALIILFFLISVLSGKKWNTRFLALYMLVIVYLTIFNRTVGNRRFSLKPFSCYRYFFTNDYLRHQILNNILLFVPLGVILSQIRPGWKSIRILPLISLGIEFLQFVTARGLFETDDLISNSLGGLIGFTAGMIWIFAAGLIQKLFHKWFCKRMCCNTRTQ